MTEYSANIAMTDRAMDRAKWAAILAKPSRKQNVNAWRAIVRFFTR